MISPEEGMSDAGDVSANSETMGSEGKRTKPNLKGGRSRSKTCLREKRLINTKVCAFRQVWLGLVSGLHKSPDDCLFIGPSLSAAMVESIHLCRLIGAICHPGQGQRECSLDISNSAGCNSSSRDSLTVISSTYHTYTVIPGPNPV